MQNITRRRFAASTTKGIAAVGMATAAASSAPASSAPASTANDTIHIGMIGMGGRARGFVNNLQRRQDVAVTAVCDVDTSRAVGGADSFAKAFGKQPATFGDYRRLLDDKSIDVVFIATPHHWHATIAIHAMQAGKDIYVEKPASHVFREGRLLVETAHKYGRVVQHGTQMRSSAVTAKAREVLDSGLIGEIKMSKAWNVQRHSHKKAVPDSTPPEGVNYDMWLGPARKRPYNANRFHHNWQWYRDYGNGDIGNDGSHDLDMARFGLAVNQHPVRITAHGSRIDLVGEREYPDNMMVAYQYDDDKVLLYEERGWTPGGIYGFDSGNAFYGTEGEMIFSRRGYFQVYLGRKREKGPGMRGDKGLPRHVDVFLESVRTREPTTADAETAHLSCGLAHLGEVAYRTGRVLHFDPETETVRDDEEANTLLTKNYRQPYGIPDVV